MTDLNSCFEKASIAEKSLPQRPDNNTMLQLYALFKQGSSGDVSGNKPGMFDFVGVAKYDAWERLKGLASDDAKNQYIDLVGKLGGSIDD
jgi:diazepam-binding inhibitor (GABA receptor modulating acyl-CoA-binding protein)